jgi:glycosyltransferase involved in cell wall biosynthesis
VRVLMLKEALPTGGAERQLALIMRHLPPQWERAAWVMKGGPFADVIAADGHRVVVAARKARYDVRPAWSLWRMLWDWRPDVVHSWDWMSTFAAAPLCRALGIPIVDATIRNGIARSKGSTQRRISQRLSRLVVANSKAGLSAWHIPAAKGRVVYNAFDAGRLASADKPVAAEASDRLTVVMVGRMVSHKDFPAVIAAARDLEARQPGRWRFLLLGSGPLLPSLRAAAADLTATGVVSFIDPGLEVLPIVAAADIGVLMANEAEHREGCSNAIMEYMSCGLPVVCSSGGGNPELVVDGVTGSLVPWGDWRALADALAFLAEHPQKAREFGEAGRRRIIEEFGVARMIRAMEIVYREALA